MYLIYNQPTLLSLNRHSHYVRCRTAPYGNVRCRSNRTHVKIQRHSHYVRHRTSPFWCFRRFGDVLDFSGIFAVRCRTVPYGNGRCWRFVANGGIQYDHVLIIIFISSSGTASAWNIAALYHGMHGAWWGSMGQLCKFWDPFHKFGTGPCRNFKFGTQIGLDHGMQVSKQASWFY